MHVLNRRPPAEPGEVYALAGLILFPEARERLAALGLDAGIFGHPWARWCAAKYLSGQQLTLPEYASAEAETTEVYSWADALDWLHPHDPAWACACIDAQAARSAADRLPDVLDYAAARIRAGTPPAEACAPVAAIVARLGIPGRKSA